MILSHKYKFIFLKTNKTAGTSIEIALSKFCGAEDVITPITAEDEVTRKELGCRGPQNYLATLRDYGVRDIYGLVVRRQRKLRFYNHIPARLVMQRVPQEVWNSYFKFCFERNPWDRFLSLYYWRCRTEPRPTVSEFLASDAPLDLKRRGFDIYTIGGKVVVDRVCLYENLTEELEAVRRLLGIPEPLVLPRAKSKFRGDRRSYREVLTEEEKAKIESLFSDEIRLFGYTY